MVAGSIPMKNSRNGREGLSSVHPPSVFLIRREKERHLARLHTPRSRGFVTGRASLTPGRTSNAIRDEPPCGVVWLPPHPSPTQDSSPIGFRCHTCLFALELGLMSTEVRCCLGVFLFFCPILFYKAKKWPVSKQTANNKPKTVVTCDFLQHAYGNR